MSNKKNNGESSLEDHDLYTDNMFNFKVDVWSLDDCAQSIYYKKLLKKMDKDIDNKVHQFSFHLLLDKILIDKKTRYFSKIFLKFLKELGEFITIDTNKVFISNKNISTYMVLFNRENYDKVFFHIYGDTYENIIEFVNNVKEKLKKFKFESKKLVKVFWYYMTDRGLKEIEIVEELSDTIIEESYPFVKDISKFCKDFFESKEQILLLMGPPGTGKTRFIRYILQKMIEYRPEINMGDEYTYPKVYYASGEKVLATDKLFIDFVHSENSILVLEDIDFHLKAREEGNTFMYKLLTASDGLIQHEKTKIILSTNISNINNVDSALLRPGRCYGIVQTRDLTKEEANKFLKTFGIKKNLEKNKYSLAELYRIVNEGTESLRTNIVKNNIGFI